MEKNVKNAENSKKQTIANEIVNNNWEKEHYIFDFESVSEVKKAIANYQNYTNRNDIKNCQTIAKQVFVGKKIDFENSEKQILNNIDIIKSYSKALISITIDKKLDEKHINTLFRYKIRFINDDRIHCFNKFTDILLHCGTIAQKLDINEKDRQISYCDNINDSINNEFWQRVAYYAIDKEAKASEKQTLTQKNAELQAQNDDLLRQIEELKKQLNK